MKVAILNLRKINFTSRDKCHKDFSEQEDLGDFADNWEGSKIREAIRNHMYPQFILDDNSSKKLPSYITSIEDVFVPNLQSLGQGSYRGASMSRNTQYLELLAKNGVNTIIDLVGFRKLQEACEEKNLKYYKYEVPFDYWSNPIFISNTELIANKKIELAKYNLTKTEFDEQLDYYKKKVKRKRAEFMEKFVGLTNIINKGHFYIGCELGEYRTPNILALNSYFNPNWQGQKMLPTDDFIYILMKNMYKNMTEFDKQKLGFTDKFEQNLRKKLNINNERY